METDDAIAQDLTPTPPALPKLSGALGLTATAVKLAAGMSHGGFVYGDASPQHAGPSRRNVPVPAVPPSQ